jgi:hypothetical protein
MGDTARAARELLAAIDQLAAAMAVDQPASADAHPVFPDEVLAHIMSYMTTRQLRKARRVCKFVCTTYHARITKISAFVRPDRDGAANVPSRDAWWWHMPRLESVVCLPAYADWSDAEDADWVVDLLVAVTTPTQRRERCVFTLDNGAVLSRSRITMLLCGVKRVHMPTPRRLHAAAFDGCRFPPDTRHLAVLAFTGDHNRFRDARGTVYESGVAEMLIASESWNACWADLFAECGQQGECGCARCFMAALPAQHSRVRLHVAPDTFDAVQAYRTEHDARHPGATNWGDALELRSDPELAPAGYVRMEKWPEYATHVAEEPADSAPQN